MLQYFLNELNKLAWICVTVLVGSAVYLLILLWRKRANVMRLRRKFSEYPIPEVTNYLYGHLSCFTDRQTEWNWARRLGKIYAFFNCDRLQVRTSDQELINEIFLKQSRRFHSRVWYEWRLLLIFESILFNKGRKWKRSRQIFMTALAAYRVRKNDSSGAIEDLSNGIGRLMRLFRQLSSGDDPKPFQMEFGKNDRDPYRNKGFVVVDDSSSRTGKSIEICAYDVMQLITLDVIFRLGFNMETVKVENGTGDPQLRLIKGWMSAMDRPFYKHAVAIPILQVFVVAYLFMFNKDFRAYRHFMRGLIGKRTASERRASQLRELERKQQDSQGELSSENNLNNSEEDSAAARTPERPMRIYHVLRDEYHAGRMTRIEAAAQMIAVLIAGFETTATTSSYIMWCLAKYTEHQAKVSADILEHGIESKYLDMFIKEVMRMYPALPHFVMRTPHEDTQVNGYKIKRGMSVYLGVNTVHYDESIWEDPHRFDPERFAEGKTYPPGAYVPFGLGHRMCAGYHLAMREMKTIVCEILSNFTIVLVEPQQMTIESANIFLTKSTHDIRVRLVPRDRTAAAFSASDGQTDAEGAATGGE